MGFLQRIAESAGEFVGRFKEASTRRIPLREIGAEGGELIDIDEELFRPLTQSRRDLTELKRERQLKLAYRLYLSNPLAYRAVEITANYVVGDGLSHHAKDMRVQKVLDDFWTDPVNRWDIKQFTRAMELGLYGEQFYEVGVDDKSGRVRMGYIDPLDVRDVLVNPENVEIPEFVLIKSINEVEDAAAGIPEAKKLKVIGPDEDANSATFGKLQGEVFFFAINKVSNAVRGNSDLLSVIDWLDTHDQFLFGIHEAAILKTSVVWDVTVKGADEKKLEALEKKFGVIKRGMTRFHSDAVEVQNISPNLETSELAEHAAVIKRHIAAGVGLPEHWLAEGGNANRATAAEMGVPTTKRLRSRQIFFKNMITFIFDFVIDQAIIHGRLPADVDRRFIVIAPQIWAVDTANITTSLLTASQAFAVAEDQGWIDNDEARKLWLLVANQLGISVGLTSLLDIKDVNAEEGRSGGIDSDYANHIRKLGEKLGTPEPGTIRREGNGAH